MAGQAPTNIVYVKLVKTNNGYEVVGPSDILQHIFQVDLRFGGLDLVTYGSNRYTEDGHVQGFADESVVKIPYMTMHMCGYGGNWTWTAWVKVLTSNGFTCKSVAYGCGGNDGGIQESEIWLFEKKL